MIYSFGHTNPPLHKYKLEFVILEIDILRSIFFLGVVLALLPLVKWYSQICPSQVYTKTLQQEGRDSIVSFTSRETTGIIRNSKTRYIKSCSRRRHSIQSSYKENDIFDVF